MDSRKCFLGFIGCLILSTHVARAQDLPTERLIRCKLEKYELNSTVELSEQRQFVHKLDGIRRRVQLFTDGFTANVYASKTALCMEITAPERLGGMTSSGSCAFIGVGANVSSDNYLEIENMRNAEISVTLQCDLIR